MFLRHTTTKTIRPSLSLLSIKPRFLSKPTTQNPNPPQPSTQNPTNSPKPTSSSSYDHLISITGRSGDLQTLKNLLNQRIKDGFFNTSNTFKFLTEKNHGPLSPILESVTRTLAELDKGLAQKSAFDALVAHLAKSRNTQHALQVLDEMLQRALGASVITFYPILSSLTRSKSMREVRNVISKMKDNGIVPDVTCYNYVVSALCHAGDVCAAAEVLTAMEREGVVADSMTYDALVLGACRVGMVDGAVGLVRRMVGDGLNVLYCTYAHVIKGLLGLGFYGLCLEFVKGFGERRERDVENFGLLARGLVKRKRFKEVRLVLREMECRGLEIEQKLKDVCDEGQGVSD